MTESEKKRYEQYKLAYAAFIAVYPFGLEDLEGEIWADIKGYEGDYQESNYGRTKSFKQKTPRIIVPMMNHKGYLYVHLCQKGNSERYFVHNLVAKCFVYNPENKPEINHDDGIKFNNYFENLKPSTNIENLQHAFKTGLMKIGVEHPFAKLSEEQIRKIRSSYIKGSRKFGCAALALKFGVGETSIWNIVNFKSYKNVK